MSTFEVIMVVQTIRPPKELPKTKKNKMGGAQSTEAGLDSDATWRCDISRKPASDVAWRCDMSHFSCNCGRQEKRDLAGNHAFNAQLRRGLDYEVPHDEFDHKRGVPLRSRLAGIQVRLLQVSNTTTLIATPTTIATTTTNTQSLSSQTFS